MEHDTGFPSRTPDDHPRSAHPAARIPTAPSRDNNVGEIERALSAALGLALAGFGLARRGGTGMAALGAGALLAWHGLKRHSLVYEKLGIREDDADTHSHPFNREAHARVNITVNRPPMEAFACWKNPDSFADFFPHVSEITPLDEHHSVWRARAPGGITIEWHAHSSEQAGPAPAVSDPQESRTIRWNTTSTHLFHLEGRIEFKPAPRGRGTHITLDQHYRLPGGAVGVVMARLLGADPRQEAAAALRRFKQRVEAGEITRADPPSARDTTNRVPAPQDANESMHMRNNPADSRELKPMRTPRGEFQPPADPPPKAPRDTKVDEALKESFPASDPPAHWGDKAADHADSHATPGGPDKPDNSGKPRRATPINKKGA